jgi:hypothetical protein
MTPTHHAVSSVVLESLAMLRSVVEDSPPEALDWTPAPGANSLTVLVLHGVTSTRFMLAAGCGHPVSIAAYRANERASAFTARGLAKAQLVEAIADLAAEIGPLLAGGSTDQLAAQVTFPEDPSVSRTGAGFLIHSAAHLREHLGHAQALRDAWDAAHPPSRP